MTNEDESAVDESRGTMIGNERAENGDNSAMIRDGGATIGDEGADIGDEGAMD